LEKALVAEALVEALAEDSEGQVLSAEEEALAALEAMLASAPPQASALAEEVPLALAA
jgi:hypothetical protein